MSKGTINYLDALLQAGLNCGLGIQGMIELLNWVRKGLYKLRNFTEEMLCGLLFLRLGSACVASLMHLTLGAPTQSTLHITVWINCQINSYIALTFCRVSH